MNNDKLVINKKITLKELLYDLQRTKTDKEAEKLINKFKGKNTFIITATKYGELLPLPTTTYQVTDGITTCHGNTLYEAIGRLTFFRSDVLINFKNTILKEN